MATPEEIHQANRQSWNHATARHNAQKGDQAGFLRQGGATLFPEEKALLGDLTSKRLVHLMCNSGQDTLCIARDHGAEVLGVDISDEAITTAQTLVDESGIRGEFFRADIYEWFDQPHLPQVDVVYLSYGALPWLSNIRRWGEGVSKALKPGGRLVLVEFHPMMESFDDDGQFKPTFDYMGGAMIEDIDGIGDYVGDSGAGLNVSGDPAEPPGASYENPHPAYAYAWEWGDIISALLASGLQLTHVQEYPYCNGWKPFPEMIEKAGRRLYLPDEMPTLPLMYSLVCEKPLS